MNKTLKITSDLKREKNVVRVFFRTKYIYIYVYIATEGGMFDATDNILIQQ